MLRSAIRQNLLIVSGFVVAAWKPFGTAGCLPIGRHGNTGRRSSAYASAASSRVIIAHPLRRAAQSGGKLSDYRRGRDRAGRSDREIFRMLASGIWK